MAAMTSAELTKKKCASCEGDVARLSEQEAAEQVRQLSGWTLEKNGKSIVKKWAVKDFAAGIRFFNEIARLAEEEDHHPDLHLEGYRNVRIELSTHSIGGLSENDFILAAKIDELPVEVAKGK